LERNRLAAPPTAANGQKMTEKPLLAAPLPESVPGPEIPRQRVSSNLYSLHEGAPQENGATGVTVSVAADQVRPIPYLTLIVSAKGSETVRTPMLNAGQEIRFTVGGNPWVAIVHSLDIEGRRANVEVRPEEMR
jgi:hypothetical protein